MSDAAFLIVDVAESHEWPTMFGNCHRVPADKRPTLLHTTRASAEAEALRLAQTHPGGQFCVFQAEQVTVRVKMPTHVNLRGEPLYTEDVARLASVREEVAF